MECSTRRESHISSHIKQAIYKKQQDVNDSEYNVLPLNILCFTFHVLLDSLLQSFSINALYWRLLGICRCCYCIFIWVWPSSVESERYLVKFLYQGRQPAALAALTFLTSFFPASIYRSMSFLSYIFMFLPMDIFIKKKFSSRLRPHTKNGIFHGLFD